jgi:hypothetical protein
MGKELVCRRSSHEPVPSFQLVFSRKASTDSGLGSASSPIESLLMFLQFRSTPPIEKIRRRLAPKEKRTCCN